jgi:membrane protein implicated in regulation of membrane protease activity
MSWWIWILIGFALLALELTATTLHIGFFAVGAFVVGILVAFGVDLPVWAQLVIFTGTSIFAFLFLRPMAVRKLRLDQKKVVDSLVGETAIPMETIAPNELGRAEMRGASWSARNVGETVLNKGQRCAVVEVEGLVLHVRAS